jgi:hypothetical protein
MALNSKMWPAPILGVMVPQREARKRTENSTCGSLVTMQFTMWTARPTLLSPLTTRWTAPPLNSCGLPTVVQ